MTRRKRTPPPAHSAGAHRGSSSGATPAVPSFRIPASLQQLSALSASLARSADKPAEEKNSKMVRAAQAQAQAALGLGLEGRKNKEKRPKPPKELKWKTDQKMFPEAQTWVKPKAGAPVSGHATFMQRRFLEGVSKTAEQTDSSGDGEEERVPAPGEVNGGGAAQQFAPAVQIVAPSLRVLMDGRVSSFPPSDGSIGTAMGQALWAGGDDNDGGPRKKRRIEFVDRPQPDFPSSQIWVKAKPRGGVVRTYGGDIEARRQAIIAQLKQTHSPVAIIGAEEDDQGRADSRGGRNPAMLTPTPKPRPPTVTAPAGARPHDANMAGAGQQPQPSDGGAAGLGFTKHQQEIAALIAAKRAQNEASGQMQRLLGLRSEHQRKLMEQQGNHHNGVQLWSSPVGGTSSQMMPRLPQQQQYHGALPLAPRPQPQPSLPLPDLSPFPPALPDEDSDEDAPGEEDTPAAQPSGPAPPAATSVVASAVPPTLNTDPGDLRSLFSSPAPSTPRPEAGGAGPMVDTGQTETQTRTPGGGVRRAQGRGEMDMERESPSAQLLMALANASTPSDQGGHRRTRSGLV